MLFVISLEYFYIHTWFTPFLEYDVLQYFCLCEQNINSLVVEHEI